MTESDPERKKPAEKLTTDEVLERVFPKEVVEHLKHLTEDEKPSQDKDTS